LLAIRRACSLVGSQSEVARLLRVAPSAVSQWCVGVRPVPPEKAVAIELAVNGLVSAEELCPAFDWDLVRGRRIP
jgi:DNA-binding transcriptional regulator YdaS (Cro superfamily)